MPRPKLVQGHPLDDDESPRRLIQVDAPTPEPEGHAFDQVSRVARADPRLTGSAYRILATIEGYCWGDRRDCWACNRTLGAQAGGIGPEQVRRCLRQLESAGYLKIEPDPSRKRGNRLILLYELKKPERYD
jgi:hypothetical protein